MDETSAKNYVIVWLSPLILIRRGLWWTMQSLRAGGKVI